MIANVSINTLQSTRQPANTNADSSTLPVSWYNLKYLDKLTFKDVTEFRMGAAFGGVLFVLEANVVNSQKQMHSPQNALP